MIVAFARLSERLVPEEIHDVAHHEADVEPRIAVAVLGAVLAAVLAIVVVVAVGLDVGLLSQRLERAASEVQTERGEVHVLEIERLVVRLDVEAEEPAVRIEVSDHLRRRREGAAAAESLIVMTVVSLPVRSFIAVNVTVYVPDWVLVGVR